MASASREQVVAVIVRVLSPFIGEAMAGASARGVCERLKLDRARLDENEIRSLLDNMSPGLNVFVGRDKTQQLVQEIWRGIRMQEGS